MILKIAFWLLLAVIAYSYLGYALLLIPAAFLRKIFAGGNLHEMGTLEPPVSLIIPAYNESVCIEKKMENCRNLGYPAEKLEIIWVTDGSDDGSYEKLQSYEGIKILHRKTRNGKSDAVNRSVKEAKNGYIVLTDANSMLNPQSIHELMKPFADDRTGCTAGEKKISRASPGKAVSAGEGIYWRYESFLKNLESSAGSVVGAAGELFAFRKDLFSELPADTLLDDFTISMNIAALGYKVCYVPGAFSTETSSASVKEELKRKKRIATGGIQFLGRHLSLLNPFRHGFLSIKYISHKVLRWVFVPFAFMALFFLNLAIVCIPSLNSGFYSVSLLMQSAFYLAAAAGMFLKNPVKGCRFAFVPFYILMMNYAMLEGIISYFRGTWTVKWPKAERL
jgi:poly-beta-1,6-N-acetyl-D-glucosamine synthase